MAPCWAVWLASLAPAGLASRPAILQSTMAPVQWVPLDRRNFTTEQSGRMWCTDPLGASEKGWSEGVAQLEDVSPQESRVRAKIKGVPQNEGHAEMTVLIKAQIL